MRISNVILVFIGIKTKYALKTKTIKKCA